MPPLPANKRKYFNEDFKNRTQKVILKSNSNNRDAIAWRKVIFDACYNKRTYLEFFEENTRIKD